MVCQKGGCIMLTVVCVCWSETFSMKNRQYDGVWVQRLKRLVEQNLNIPHRFVCLTNLSEIEGVETIPFIHDWTAMLNKVQSDPSKWNGCWSKIELFRPDLPGDRFLYLDLDSLPVDNLDDLVNHPGSLIGINPRVVSRASTWINPKRKKAFCSGAMVWNKGYADIIYNNFTRSVMERLIGDQDWIAEIITSEGIEYEFFPSDWICLLRNAKNSIPLNTRVICCSPNGWRQDLVVAYKGKKYKWVERLWKTGTII